MPSRQRLWNRQELILAFNLYLKLPFGKLHKGRPEVKELAELIGRSANSIALRLVNFAACDPYLKERGIKGMPGGAKQCQPIWDEYLKAPDKILFEGEQMLAQLQNTTIEQKYDRVDGDIGYGEGKNYVKEIQARVNQYIFRKIVLANYDCQCAISGVDIPELLVASHIIPWAANKKTRLNPANGICLSSLYDKAFDCGLLTFTENLKITLSPRLKSNIQKEYYDRFFAPYDDEEIIAPQKYIPNPEFLLWHRENVFQKY